MSGQSDQYANFLRIQLKTAPRLKIFKTRKQAVEKLPPLKDEI